MEQREQARNLPKSRNHQFLWKLKKQVVRLLDYLHPFHDFPDKEKWWLESLIGSSDTLFPPFACYQLSIKT